MTKLRRDASAFAQRVKIGSARLWLLVEGRTHDAAFYDRVLGSHPELREGDYSIRAVEQLELDGTSAGGKSFAYKIFEYFSTEGLLKQQVKQGERFIAFALDRDYEDIADTMKTGPHVIYTEAVDVEAEILVNGDLLRASSSAYSLPSEVLMSTIGNPNSLPEELARRWREWITFRAIASCCDTLPGVQNAAHSQVNINTFGEVDLRLVASMNVQFEGVIFDEIKRLARAAAIQKVDAYFTAQRGAYLLKGKWIAKFVFYLINRQVTDWPRQANVPADTLTKTCMETLRFGDTWFGHYDRRISLLLAS